ncbi:membrane protein [Agaricicola taiwanensis]|uniref:Membrane protein n=1 Tax=Agaricicola taiwanensis TaxID=591372 RepID=A0A8J2VMF6_9RHOB|nr:EamA family transporter [Agaricicola taiwanensis]GGE32048.1 membrane protein [Agaricicola taiwanensis]
MSQLSATERTLLPSLAVVASLFSVNVGAAFAKDIFPQVGIEGVTALRVGISAVVLLALWRPWDVRLARRDLVSLLIYGATLGLMNLSIYHAFARIPLGIALAIEVVGPLAVVLLTSRRLQDFVWTALAIVGLYLLLVPEEGVPPLDPWGIMFAASAGACWAFYIVFGKRVSSAMAGGKAVALGMVIAAVITVPLGAATSGAAMLQGRVLLIGLLVALLSSAVPYTLEMQALRRLSSRVFGILVSSAPAIAALAGFLVLGEKLAIAQWVAISIVILASAGATATAAKRAA